MRGRVKLSWKQASQFEGALGGGSEVFGGFTRGRPRERRPAGARWRRRAVSVRGAGVGAGAKAPGAARAFGEASLTRKRFEQL